MVTPEREVTVHGLTLIDFDEDAQTARLIAVTGSGTYIRSLVEDIGYATGAGAYAAALRRTRIGHFSVADALTPEELSVEKYQTESRSVLSIDDALGFIPRHELNGREAHLAANGNEIKEAPMGRFRAYGPQGLLAVYEGFGDRARPLVVFPGHT